MLKAFPVFHQVALAYKNFSLDSFTIHVLGFKLYSGGKGLHFNTVLNSSMIQKIVFLAFA